MLIKTDLWHYLKTVKKPLVLYGTGNGADKITAVLKSLNIPISGIFASDGFIRNKTFYGLPVESYTSLEERFGEMVVLMCFGSSRPEVLENVKRIAKSHELYVPEVPVYGEGLFTLEYAAKHKKQLEYVYDRLYDRLSKKVFQNIIQFKISGMPQYLFDCETPQNEIYESILSFTDSETYLDLGAYNGDTAEDFIRRTNGYKEITAVEPDIKTFKKLKANTAKYADITCINACIGDKNGTVPFNMKGGRGSFADTAGTEIPLITVDKIAQNKNVSFIKADVEGEELKMINGAADTIARSKPKMRIAAYHRTEDMFALPIAVDNIRNDYRIYLRHSQSLPAWDTDFYFV